MVITRISVYATAEVFRGHYTQMVEGIDGWLKASRRDGWRKTPSSSLLSMFTNSLIEIAVAW